MAPVDSKIFSTVLTSRKVNFPAGIVGDALSVQYNSLPRTIML